MSDCKNCKHLVMYDYKNKSYSCELGECEFEPEEQEPILDKLRSEIETKYGQCSICEYDSDYGGRWYYVGDIADILQMIDNCKAETEAEDGNDIT